MGNAMSTIQPCLCPFTCRTAYFWKTTNREERYTTENTPFDDYVACDPAGLLWQRDDSSIERPGIDGAAGGRSRAIPAQPGPGDDDQHRDEPSAYADDGTHGRARAGTDISADE